MDISLYSLIYSSTQTDILILIVFSTVLRYKRDYDEPHVIGASPDADGAIELVIKAYLDAGVTFACPNTGKKLRIYARPLTEAGKKILNPDNEENTNAGTN